MVKVRLTMWNDDRTKAEIQKRFRNAKKARESREDQWEINERAVFGNRFGDRGAASSLWDYFSNQVAAVDSSNAEMSVSYAFKNLRFIHSQMAANPPSVVMKPATSDQEDHRKADAADKASRYAMRKYFLTEKFSQASLSCLVYGTGVLKTEFDPTKGDILSFDKEKSEMEVEGDLNVSNVDIRNVFIDPDARTVDEVKWVIERIYMDYDEALTRWPDKKKLLDQARVSQNSTATEQDSTLSNQTMFNMVELLEYWETGLPSNGYMGRYSLTTVEGNVLVASQASPFRFVKAGTVAELEQKEEYQDMPDEEREDAINRLPEQASLPYHILTDIDVPNSVWGASFLEYIARLQINLDKLDTAVLDKIQAHGIPRLVLPESADLESYISDSTWDVVRMSGNQPPYFVNPPQAMPDMTNTRVNIIQGINDVSGVNESMFGQQSRETAGTAMQFATNQGNMIRHRLFTKYVMVTESVYRAILDLIRKHWTDKRVIRVAGNEKALESITLKGTDVDGGYDIIGQYGRSLSLDPTVRKQEIIQLLPILEKAGVHPRSVLKFLKLAELESVYDELDLAASRQREIFELIVETEEFVEPEKYMDHENMIAYSLKYFMTSEFNMLPRNVKDLCKQHMEARIQLAAQEQMEASGGVPPSPEELEAQQAPEDAALMGTQAPPGTSM